MSSKLGGLKAICNALNDGDTARAQIAAVLLAIPDRPALINGKCARDHMIKFIRDLHWSKLINWDGEDAPNSALSSQDICLTKAGYNSREPRDDLGQWTDSGGSNAASANPLLQYGAGEGTLNDGVYHPGVDPGQLDDAAGEQVQLNRLQHDLQVVREMRSWRQKGFVPVPNVMFEDPRNGTPIVADYVVSMWVPDPESFFLFERLEPILVRDVKTGGGGLTDNQKQVYPYMLRGGEVVPVGDNAALAGFEVGEPTVIAEMYAGHDLPSDTVH
jgi:hypothetical protein